MSVKSGSLGVSQMTLGELTAVGGGKGPVWGQLLPQAFLRREERNGSVVGENRGQRRDVVLGWERFARWLEGPKNVSKGSHPSKMLKRSTALDTGRQEGDKRVLRGRGREEWCAHWVIHSFIQKISNNSYPFNL